MLIFVALPSGTSGRTRNKNKHRHMERRHRHYFLGNHNDDDRILAVIAAGKQSKTGLRILAMLLAERWRNERSGVYTANNVRTIAAALQCSRQATEKAVNELRAEHLISHTYSAFRPNPR